MSDKLPMITTFVKSSEFGTKYKGVVNGFRISFTQEAIGELLIVPIEGPMVKKRPLIIVEATLLFGLGRSRPKTCVWFIPSITRALGYWMDNMNRRFFLPLANSISDKNLAMMYGAWTEKRYNWAVAALMTMQKEQHFKSKRNPMRLLQLLECCL